MNNAPDDDLRRLFAASGSVGPDEAFVARISSEVTRRRRWLGYRRSVLTGVGAALVLALAVTLAPFAPGSGDAFSQSLFHFPDLVTGAALSEAARSSTWHLPTSPWMVLVVVAAALPLAGTAWLVRRGVSPR